MRPETAVVTRTPRVLSPDGKMVYGTWPGPQDRIWEFKGRYGLAGGSGNTGKSDLLRWMPFQQIEEDNARIAAGEIKQSIGWALYLRREMPLLREVMARCQRDYPSACPGAEWKAQPSTWIFPNGYRVTFGHMQNPEDWQKYQGFQLTMVLWDELCTFTEEQFNMLDTWLRQPAGSKLTPVHRAGANPVGIGRPWVKRFFDIRKGDVEKELTTTQDIRVDDEFGARTERVKRTQLYVKIRVSDNKSIDQAAYIASFKGKPRSVVRALLDGDWESAAGNLIGETWDEDVHVCTPYVLPATRYKFRSIHFAYALSTVKWFVVDVDGNMAVYRELSLKNHTAQMVADRVQEAEEEHDEWNRQRELGSRLVGVLGPASCWAKTNQRGPTAAETLRRAGIRSRPADENVIAAVDQIRQRLISRSKKGVPGLRYFDTCAGSLETVPSMTAAKDEPDMPDPKQDLSAFLCLCYAVMSRPFTPTETTNSDDEWDKAEKPRVQRRARGGQRSSYPGIY